MTLEEKIEERRDAKRVEKREERRRKWEHGRREVPLRVFEGDLRDRLRLRRGECS